MCFWAGAGWSGGVRETADEEQRPPQSPSPSGTLLPVTEGDGRDRASGVGSLAPSARHTVLSLTAHTSHPWASVS